MTNLDLKEVDAIVDSIVRSQSAVIPLLQAVRNRYHYPSGRHTVRVHIGTAYHIKGADTIFDE